MRTSGKCKTLTPPRTGLKAVFCFPLEPNIPEEQRYEKNINTISMHGGEVHRSKDSYCDLEIIWKTRSFRNIENLQCKKTADSIL